MYNKLNSKEVKLAVVGLGYVGLPLALEFAKHFKVIGYDIKEKNLDMLRRCIVPSDLLHNQQNEKHILLLAPEVAGQGEAQGCVGVVC